MLEVQQGSVINLGSKEQEPSESEQYHLLYFLLFKLKFIYICRKIQRALAQVLVPVCVLNSAFF